MLKTQIILRLSERVIFFFFFWYVIRIQRNWYCSLIFQLKIIGGLEFYYGYVHKMTKRKLNVFILKTDIQLCWCRGHTNVNSKLSNPPSESLPLFQQTGYLYDLPCADHTDENIERQRWTRTKNVHSKTHFIRTSLYRIDEEWLIYVTCKIQLAREIRQIDCERRLNLARRMRELKE